MVLLIVNMMPDPFHLVMPGAGIISPFVDPDHYDELEAAWPDYDQIARGRTGNNKLFQRSATEVLGSSDIAQIWQDFFNQMLFTFTDRVEEMFGVTFPKDRAIRGTDRAEFYVDCQFGVNSPTQTRCRVRGPHVDNPIEAYGCCFYMRDPKDNSEGGNLIFYKWNSERKFHGKAEIEDSLVDPVETVCYGKNIAAVFLNSVDALHGVSNREVTEYPRRYINIIGEYNTGQFELPR